MPNDRPLLDPDAVTAFSEKVWATIAGTRTTALCFLGDQLGLYRALAATGTVTSHDLALYTGLHERWLREWLHHQACAGFVAYAGDGRFYLTPEAIDVFTNENSLFFAGGGITTAMALVRTAPQLQQSFQTGLGLPYDAFGVDCAIGMERMGNAWKRQKLVPELLPLFGGVVEKLEQGALVADIGCGVGTALLVMAAAFPHSTFHGYDTSQYALAEAHQRTVGAGVTNVVWHHLHKTPLPNDHRYDFVTAFDVVHDTADPQGLITSVYHALKPDGTWCLIDMAAHASFEENLRQHPAAETYYAYSVLLCLSSSLSAPGGAGLGTAGFHEGLARQMTYVGGFRHFRKLDVVDDFNNYYEVRP